MEVNSDSNYKKLRDAELVKRAIHNRDESAYGELMDLYYQPLFIYLHSKTRNHEDADDLTIETFAKAFRNLPNYSEEHCFSTWLFGIANNHFIDFYRRKNRLKEILKAHSINDSSVDSDYEIPCDDLDPEESYISKEVIHHLKKIIRQLKQDYQDMIKMRFFDELSYEEIQQKTNLPMGTLKAKLYRAKNLLQSMVEYKD
ncbi:MAG: RNA polymerase sigma factor [Hyphomicrobiales bacterium]